MTAPLILACDTTQGACSAALFQNGLLAKALQPMTKGHAEALMPMLETLLADAAVDIQRIDRLAVTHGPGTFTGVRVGISAMRGLALALDRPVKTYGTLEVMARGAAAHNDLPILVAVDARRETFYAQSFSADGRPQNPPQALDAAAALALEPSRPLAVLGSGANLLQAVDSNIRVCEPTDCPDYPDAAVLAAMAAADNEWHALPAAAPLYLRPPDATLPDPGKKIALAEFEAEFEAELHTDIETDTDT